MRRTLLRKCNLRQGKEVAIQHVIRWFCDGAVSLDGVLILPQHIKAKLGGDEATRKLWAEMVDGPEE
jgi:hypothetical protein